MEKKEPSRKLLYGAFEQQDSISIFVETGVSNLSNIRFKPHGINQVNLQRLKPKTLQDKGI